MAVASSCGGFFVHRLFHVLPNPLNRITAATDNTRRFGLSNLRYDKNGNITHLTRGGHLKEMPDWDKDDDFGTMDQLDYQYFDGSNRLRSVTDGILKNDTSGKGEFVDGNKDGDDYVYDPNGNMTQDLNKGIKGSTPTEKGIQYNHLNLPTKVSIDDGGANKGTISYIYDATGVKLRKNVLKQGETTPTATDYAGNFIYENGNLRQFGHPEGYVEPDGQGGYNYVYNYKDQIENVRLSYSDLDGNGSIDPATEILHERNYYPFGLEHKGYNNVVNGVEYKYQTFQGQELNDELGLNWLSFKWRNHDPAIGRFMGIDPLAEQYNYQSPYNFAENRVIDGFELEGLEWVDTDNGWDYQGYTYGDGQYGPQQNTIGIAPEGSRPVASWVSNAPIPQTGQVLNVGGPDGTIQQFPANGNGMVELPHSGTEQTGAGTSGTYEIDRHTVYGYYNRNDVAGAVEDQWGTVENVSNMINAITEFDTSTLLANPLQIGDMRSPTNGRTNISASSTHHGNNGSFDIRLLGTNGGLPGGTTINNNNFSTQNTQSFINALGNNGFSRFLIGPNAVPNLNNSGTINVRNGGNVHNNHYHIDID